MTAHDRYERLAGAVLLGEASDDERAAFDEHAATCATCRADSDPSLMHTLAIARDAEIWRPSLDQAVLARIRERHAYGSRLTTNALGWGAGVSIVLNVLFVTGLAGQIARALAPTASDPPAITTLGIRLPAQTFAHVTDVARVSRSRARVVVRLARSAHVAAERDAFAAIFEPADIAHDHPAREPFERLAALAP